LRIRSIHLVIGLVIPFNLFALGLGEIRVYSHLNEPFRAEIPLIDAGSVSIKNIKAEIGTNEEFARVGLTRDEVLSLLQLKIKRNQEGRLVVALNSTERIQTPYLEILVDLAWPDGELYRAFTVLLDPPHYPQNQENGTLVRALPLDQMKQGDKTWFNSSSGNVKEKAPESRSSSTYGPTLVDERIWQIAKRYQLDKLTLPQVVLSIVGQNPDAFQEGNLNGLKAASHLMIPSFDEMFKVPVNLGAQEVEVHDIAWRTHSQINHVLAPPYMQGIQEMTSLIPSIPAFKQQAVSAVILESKPSVPSNEVTKPMPADDSAALATQMKKLERSLQLKEQENHALNQKITELGKQLAQRQISNQGSRGQVSAPQGQASVPQGQASAPGSQIESDSYLWLYLLLLAAALGGYLVWKRRKASGVETVKEVPSPTIMEPTQPHQPVSSFTEEETPVAEMNKPVEVEKDINTQSPQEDVVEAEKDIKTQSLQEDAVEVEKDIKTQSLQEDAVEVEKDIKTQSPQEDAVEVEKDIKTQSPQEPTSPSDEKPGSEAQPAEDDLASFKFEEEQPTAPKARVAKEPELVKSPEALETLLQLAKTYISRGDLQAARRGLQEVLEYGDHQQQQEATLLLEQIEGKK
jgi:pilus assembly protein FimV